MRAGSTETDLALEVFEVDVAVSGVGGQLGVHASKKAILILII